MQISEMKESFSKLVSKRLDELLTPPALPQKKLFEAARYSVLGPGKRLRPVLLLSILHAYKVPIEYGLDLAAALELIHSYSLIHDDLPCMDNDDLRRGKPTLHKVYSEAEAVLTGDFLLTFAFEVISSSKFLTADQKVKVIKILSIRSGALGMIGGQYIDLASEGHKIGWETLEYMHLHKTAGLFTAAFEMGGIVCLVSKQDLDYLQEIGQLLGIAYQVIDDIMDHLLPEKSSDLANHKATTVSMLGLEKAEDKARLLLEETLKIASKLSTNLPFFGELVGSLFQQLSLFKSKNT